MPLSRSSVPVAEIERTREVRVRVADDRAVVRGDLVVAVQVHELDAAELRTILQLRRLAGRDLGVVLK